jgi:hypothetical protein
MFSSLSALSPKAQGDVMTPSDPVAQRGALFVRLLTCAILCCSLAALAGEAPAPLPNAYAHNDYVHKRPLLDALDHGFCSVEADIHLVDGQLLVAHDRDQVKPERTLQALYLDPLRERAQANGGKIYPDGPTVMLLIDIKSPGQPTYAVLRELLAQYKGMLTEYQNDATRVKAVSVVISGNRPKAAIAADNLRLAAIDGRSEDLDRNPSRHLVPLVSSPWGKHFTWNGRDEMPRKERKALRAMVKTAHKQGRTLRFWATPDRPEVWDELLAAEVDLIGSDNLGRLRDYLVAEGKTFRSR